MAEERVMNNKMIVVHVMIDHDYVSLEVQHVLADRLVRSNWHRRTGSKSLVDQHYTIALIGKVAVL